MSFFKTFDTSKLFFIHKYLLAQLKILHYLTNMCKMVICFEPFYISGLFRRKLEHHSGKYIVKVFKSWQSYWHFAHTTRHENRYIYGQSVEGFLEAVVATSKDRQAEIPEGGVLYRAQLDCDTRPVYQNNEVIADEEWPYPPKRMLPIKGKSSEGRANPRGITNLYLANNKNTACAEVRPWKGAYISVAVFKVKRELKVIDCSKDIKEKKPISFYFEEPEPEAREKCVWADINKAFSKPVNPNDPETEYVPTQIIAEVLRKEGYDGIAY